MTHRNRNVKAAYMLDEKRPSLELDVNIPMMPLMADDRCFRVVSPLVVYWSSPAPLLLTCRRILTIYNIIKLSGSGTAHGSRIRRHGRMGRQFVAAEGSGGNRRIHGRDGDGLWGLARKVSDGFLSWTCYLGIFSSSR